MACQRDRTQQGSFGPHVGESTGQWAQLGRLVADDPETAWRRLLEITAVTDDAGLFWVADILEDLVARHALGFAPRIETELASNLRLRQAFLDFVPPAGDEIIHDRLLAIRERIEAERGINRQRSPGQAR